MKFSNLLFSLSRNIRRVAIRLSQNDEWRNTLKKWKKDNKEVDLRTNYPELNASALVLDLGGYQGQWASDIFARYRCHVAVFEPYTKYADQIERRFEHNEQISVHVFGLSNAEKTMEIGIADDATSVFKAKGQNQTAAIALKKASTFLVANDMSNIALMKINIEGGEYDLLEHLIDEGLTANIQNLQIQFHDFVPNAESRMKAIQEALSKTHQLSYQYPFLWENWRLK